MKFGDKDFEYYWKIVKVPFFILIGWNILSLIVAKISIQQYYSIFGGYSSLVLGILVYAFVGWTIVADHKGSVANGFWGGAVLGVISGFVAAVIGILTIHLVPDVVEPSISQMVSSGMAEETARQFIQVGTYINLVINPLVAFILGGLISLLVAFITFKFKK